MPIAKQLDIHPTKIKLLQQLPVRVRSLLSGRSVDASGRVDAISLPAAIRRFIRTPARISVPEFAAKYRYVTDPPHDGPWRHKYAPHTVKIMATFGLSWVREIWFCGVEQSGKTNTMLNCMAWAIEQSPGNIYYLMPSENDANKIVGGKIRPMLAQSTRLASYLSTRSDDTSLSRIFLKNGITIFPAHANSAGSLASWPAKHCFGDEVDKYPALVGKETDPITLIGKRNRTYPGRYKRFFASTPAGKFISKGCYACHQVWQYRARCPHCSELIRMDAEHLGIDEHTTLEHIDRHGCDYLCQACGSAISENERIQAIKGGAWVAVKGGEISRPERVGFHHRAWDCLDVSLREIATKYLKALTGDMAAKIDYAHGVEAENYEYVQQDRGESAILALVDESMPRKTVPRDQAALLLLVDTQKYGFRYQIWAIGWGDNPVIHVIDRGFAKQFSELEVLASTTYADPDGRGYRIHAAWIDSGGGTDPNHPKHSRTKAVYVFCKKNPIFNPIKGRRNQGLPWDITRLDYLPSTSGKKIPIPGGLTLYKLNVTVYKGELAAALEIPRGDNGSLVLHAEMGKDYAAQMCAEYQDDRGYWICPNGKANHDWDISVYGFAAIDIMGIRGWQKDPDEPQLKQPSPRRQKRRW